MRFFLRNLELILTSVGLLVVFVTSAVATSLGLDHWKTATLAAVVVGLVHGVLFWVVRRRQRTIREAAFHEIQAMLSDIINNQLAIIEFSGHTTPKDQRPNTRFIDHISTSIGIISQSLRTLSEESLTSWRNKYDSRPR